MILWRQPTPGNYLGQRPDNLISMGKVLHLRMKCVKWVYILCVQQILYVHQKPKLFVWYLLLSCIDHRECISLKPITIYLSIRRSSCHLRTLIKKINFLNHFNDRLKDHIVNSEPWFYQRLKILLMGRVNCSRSQPQTHLDEGIILKVCSVSTVACSVWTPPPNCNQGYP